MPTWRKLRHVPGERRIWWYSMDIWGSIQRHRLVKECFWLLLVWLLLIERTADNRRRGRSRGGVGGSRGVESRIRTSFLFYRRLLVDWEELALFAQTDTVFAATLGIIGGN